MKQSSECTQMDYLEEREAKDFSIMKKEKRKVSTQMSINTLKEVEVPHSQQKKSKIAAVFGIGFPPFTGGPFRAIDAWGAKTVVDRMNELKAKYGERFTPAKSLVEMAASGKRYHED